jgi:hypothetical protein
MLFEEVPSVSSCGEALLTKRVEHLPTYCERVRARVRDRAANRAAVVFHKNDFYRPRPDIDSNMTHLF